jgi:hypothetical protein
MADFKLILSPFYFQDFETVVPVGKTVSCYTSYNYLWADSRPDGGFVTDEVAAAIARNDLRHVPR